MHALQKHVIVWFCRNRTCHNIVWHCLNC